MPYQHGMNGIITSSIVKGTRSGDVVAVYIGTAPINLVPGYAEKNLVNIPIKINNLGHAQQTVGYSDNFADYTLCEAISQHFDNPNGNIGPIYVINVLDPSVHKATQAVTGSHTPDNNKIVIADDKIILDTIAIEDKTSDDFTIEYDYSRAEATITFVAAQTAAVKVTYNRVDVSKVTAADIIGSTTSSGVKTGLQALDRLYPMFNAIVNLLAAPGWSSDQTVYAAMCSKVQKLGGHWNGFVIADIPVKDGDNKIDTIEKAIQWKQQHGYNKRNSAVCWPMAKDAAGRTIHLSSAYAAKQMEIDVENQCVPFATASNQKIAINTVDFGDSQNQGYSDQESNDLNAVGITTATYQDGAWVLWGPHNASYSYGAAQDPLDMFVTNYRVMCHVLNRFQADHAPKIDQPMTLALKNTILEQESDKIDRLMAMGALIGTVEDNYIDFVETENPVGEIMEGNFVFSFLGTVTPPFKSGTIKITYTDSGLASLYGE